MAAEVTVRVEIMVNFRIMVNFYIEFGAIQSVPICSAPMPYLYKAHVPCP